MKRLLSRYSEVLFLLLRIAVAFLFGSHGVQKFGYLRGFHPAAGTLLWWAGYIETIGAPLIAIGLATRWVALILAGEMFVAYFHTHAFVSPWPIINGGEITVFYFFFYLYLAARGPGRYSVDRALGWD
jgi:putative oxidoreductase